MEFKEYMHVERFGSTGVEGIEMGECYVFPKIDGTNASVWMDGYGIQAGSRKRHLSLEADNAGFFNYVSTNEVIKKLLEDHPHLRLFGEWLVPHTIKTYREDAWRRFYVFDVLDESAQEFVPYMLYQELLEAYEVDYVPAIVRMINPTYDSLLKVVQNNTYFIKDGQGIGEGVVVKNYDYKNKFGHTIWAKLVTNEFKEKASKIWGPADKLAKDTAERRIVDKYVTPHLVDKTYAKIDVENGGWSSRMIPQLLGRIYYDLVQEETWNFIKEFKNPTVNFKVLSSLCIQKTKELKPELF